MELSRVVEGSPESRKMEGRPETTGGSLEESPGGSVEGGGWGEGLGFRGAYGG